MDSIIPSIFLFIFFLLPIVLAIKFYGWRDITAFLIAIFLVPIVVFCVVGLSTMFLEKKPVDFRGAFEIGALFGFVGVPIFFFIIIPIYYRLKTLSMSLYISFPASVAMVMLTLYVCLATRDIVYEAIPVIVACGIVHAFLIIWLIKKINTIFPAYKSKSHD